MKYLLVILLFISIGASAQSEQFNALTKAFGDLDEALIHKDSIALKKLLNIRLSYGHSNGWIETKKDVIEDLFNGKISYRKITVGDSILMTIEDNTGYVRMKADVEVLLDGKPIQLRLNVLQVWIRKNKHWQLFARQSVKI